MKSNQTYLSVYKYLDLLGKEESGGSLVRGPIYFALLVHSPAVAWGEKLMARSW